MTLQNSSPDSVDDVLSGVVNTLADPCDASDFNDDEAAALRQTIKDALGGLKELRSILSVAQGVQERIAELQYEAGMYQSLYENAIASQAVGKPDSVREQCIKICLEEANEWDSDNLQTLKNYAGHCANRIAEEVPSPAQGVPDCGDTDVAPLREQIAVAMDPLSFALDYKTRHKHCSPFKIEYAQAAWLERADTIIALLVKNGLLNASPAQSSWQPISTAPKDGTRILLRFEPPFHDTTEIGVTVGCWTGNTDHWWLTCINASSSAHKEPVEWSALPSTDSRGAA